MANQVVKCCIYIYIYVGECPNYILYYIILCIYYAFSSDIFMKILHMSSHESACRCNNSIAEIERCDNTHYSLNLLHTE